MSRLFNRHVLPFALATAACLANAQVEEKEKWQQWYSETLGVSFMSLGKPVDEVVAFKGPLADGAEKTVAVAFNVEMAEFSIVRLRLKPSMSITPKQALEYRLSVPKAKAPDFVVKEQKELFDSDYPCVSAWVEYTGPENDKVSRRILIIAHDRDVWLLEGSGLTEQSARISANWFFDSIRMDPEGKIKPGDPKR